MKRGCMICLEDVAEGAPHARCLRGLFDKPAQPAIDLDLAKLHTAGLSMVGRVSLSGIQRKVSLGFGDDRMTLQIVTGQARYVLKPQAGTYPNLPENEHVSMRLAQLWGIDVPPCGLMRLRDESIAYIVRRFDRPAAGGKLRQEDFCQLSELPPKNKYDGSAELCVRVVKRFSSEPLVELRKLFAQLLFAWWTGNGDLHLKNLSLYVDRAGLAKLTPAYDLLNTRLVIPVDTLALTVGGKKDNLRRKTWLELARYAGLPERAALRVLHLPTQTLHTAQDVIGRSFLPDEMRSEYQQLLAERAAQLAA